MEKDIKLKIFKSKKTEEESIGDKAYKYFIKIFDPVLETKWDKFSEGMGIESFILNYEKGVYFVSGKDFDFIVEYIPEESKFKGKYWKKCCYDL